MTGIFDLLDLQGSAFHLATCGLFAIGLIGMVTRRSILHVLCSGLICALCPFMILANVGNKGLFVAVTLSLSFGLLFLCTTGAVVSVYRRRGTINIDELRELRG